MTIIYEGVPTFEERVLGAIMIIVGRVEKTIKTSTDHDGDDSQLQTIFHVSIESILKGKTTSSSVKVRVVSNRAEKKETAGQVLMNIGDRVLLMLSPDYGPTMTDDSFVLYFASCYQIIGEDQVKLDENTAKQLTNKKIQIEKTMVKLEVIRSLIITVMQSKEKKETDLAKLEPVEMRRMPYPEISEVPQPIFGGASSSSPENRDIQSKTK